MSKPNLVVVAVLGTVGALGLAIGCGGSSPRKIPDGGAGSGGAAGMSTGGTGGGTAGSTGGTGGSTGGTGGDVGGVAGATGGTAGTDAGGVAGATGGTAGGAAGTAPPPTITATTSVIEIDDVIVSLKGSDSDGGVDAADDAAASDGGVDAAEDGAVASADGGIEDADAASDVPVVTGPPAVGVSYTFDTSALGLQGWHYTIYGSTPSANDPTNLALTSTLVWSGTDDADGKSTSGVLKGTVPFQYLGDRIDFQAFTQPTGKYDWSGFTISAKVKLVSGGNIAYGCPIEADIYVSDANGYNTKLSALVNLVTGGWVTVTYDMADALAQGVDITNITQMGLQIDTGTVACVGTTPPDAGTGSDASDAGAGGDASEVGDGGDAADAGVSSDAAGG